MAVGPHFNHQRRVGSISSLYHVNGVGRKSPAGGDDQQFHARGFPKLHLLLKHGDVRDSDGLGLPVFALDDRSVANWTTEGVS